jgi:GNAT superfamily N-acetyltransferase
METVFNVNRLIDTELHFAKRFTGVLAKPYGLLYWNEANKLSHDSNHAIITDIVGVESSIKDIVSYYKAKQITPRIYSSLKANQLATITPHLTKYDFVIDRSDVQFLLHEKDSAIEPVHGIRFERIKSVEAMLREMIISGEYGEWTVKVFERHLRHPGFHLIGGFVEDELVSTASVNIFEGYSRVDDVYTHKFYRSKGYSSALLHYLVKYHKEQSDNHLYLYSDQPQAIRIYEKAGFVKIHHDFECWRAHKPL